MVQTPPGHHSKASIRTGQKPRVLFSISSFFPLDFFPDSLIVDEEKITLVYRSFPFQRNLISLYYGSLMGVVIEMGIFFATINFDYAIGLMDEEPPPLRFLGKSQAAYARKLITGLIRLHQREDFDFGTQSREEILEAATNEGTSYLGLA